jgi:hypothetical protein
MATGALLPGAVELSAEVSLLEPTVVSLPLALLDVSAVGSVLVIVAVEGELSLPPDVPLSLDAPSLGPADPSSPQAASSAARYGNPRASEARRMIVRRGYHLAPGPGSTPTRRAVSPAPPAQTSS